MQKNKATKLCVFVDGASRGNPGLSGAGVYIKQNDKQIVKKGFFLEDKTNNQAEYLALALAIFLFKKKLSKKALEDTSIEITSDSELLVKQMKGEYKVKNPSLAKIKNLIDLMLQGVDYKIKHTLRENNKVADKLANEGIETKEKMPEDFLCLLKENKLLKL